MCQRTKRWGKFLREADGSDGDDLFLFSFLILTTFTRGSVKVWSCRSNFLISMTWEYITYVFYIYIVMYRGIKGGITWWIHRLH